MRINYHATADLWLSLEDFHNAGYTSEQTKAVIERHRDCDGMYLRCENMGINGNWIVRTCSLDPDYHAELVWRIGNAILREKPEGKKKGYPKMERT